MARSASAVVMKKKRAIVSFVPAPANFVSAFYERLLPTDITLFSKEDRARIAASIWEFAAARRVGESRVRVFNPSREIEGWSIDHTVIEIVNDDMPFLVDSVTGVLQRRGLTVHIVIHPVLSVVRDSKGKATGVVSANAAGAHSESFMHIEIDHCIEPFQLKEIEKEVQETLTDVRAAVKDWGKMRDAMGQPPNCRRKVRSMARQMRGPIGEGSWMKRTRARDPCGNGPRSVCATSSR